MPVIDGYETAELIRKRQATAKVPIIFVTAFDQDITEIIKGYETGAVDYIIKPYNPKILRSKVKVLVELFRTHEELQKMQLQNSKLIDAIKQGGVDTIYGTTTESGTVRVQDSNLVAQNEQLMLELKKSNEELSSRLKFQK